MTNIDGINANIFRIGIFGIDLLVCRTIISFLIAIATCFEVLKKHIDF